MILGVAQSIGFRLDPGWGILAAPGVVLALIVGQWLVSKTANRNVRSIVDPSSSDRRPGLCAPCGAVRQAAAPCSFILFGVRLAAAGGLRLAAQVTESPA